MSSIRLEQQQYYYLHQPFSMSPQRKKIYYYVNLSPSHTLPGFIPAQKSQPNQLSHQKINLNSKAYLITETSKQHKEKDLTQQCPREISLRLRKAESEKSKRQKVENSPKLQYINESVQQIIQQSFKKRREIDKGKKKKDDIMQQIKLLEQQLNKLKLE